MLSKTYIRWVLLAKLIAWPVAYGFAQKFLQIYANRIHVTIWMFYIPALLALVIAFLTVGYQSFKTAVANSAAALRVE